MRRFQFRLRTVLILTAVIAVSLAWCSWKAEKQRRAVETLEKRGATIYYGDSDIRVIFWNPKPWFLHWQLRVTEVDLLGQVSDSDIEALQALDGLKQVTANFGDETRLRTALPNCKFEGQGAYAAP